MTCAPVSTQSKGTLVRTKPVTSALAAITAALMSLAATPVAAQAAAKPAPRDATYATVLSGRIPCPINPYYPELGCGRMRQGKLTLKPGNSPYATVEIKNIDSNWKRTSVRFVDVAGTRHKEAVVIISANAGGVGWPNYVLVYDGTGKLINIWDSGKATDSDPREGTSFSTARKNSVDVRVEGIQKRGEGACCGTGKNIYRLSKGTNGKPHWKLISRR